MSLSPLEPRFGDAEATQADRLIRQALEEDLPRGDVTTDPLFPREAPEVRARMAFVAREPGVLCGVAVVERLFATIDPSVALCPAERDGEPLEAGGTFLEVEGRVGSLLRGERTALNFLQRLSGIATETARWVEALQGRAAELLDTRKTTPGWRWLEKYAVRAGGGTNHRGSLSDAILLKDNHAWLLARTGRPDPRDWVASLRAASAGLFLELEVDTRQEFLAAREARPDAILLDNFALEDLRWAVERNRELPPPRPLLEASGGLDLERVAAVADTGVDRLSVGALTHSVRALDISLECRSVSPGPAGGEEE